MDAVDESDKPGTGAWVDTTDAVVADDQVQGTFSEVSVQEDDRGLGVLGGIGERLGGDVVRGDFGGFRQPYAHGYIEFYGDGAAAGQCLECWAESAFGQDRGVDTAGEFSQLFQCVSESVG